MKALERELVSRDIAFDFSDNCICCFPHVINLCTSHVIESFTSSSRADGEQGDDADGLNPCNPIAKCRSFVRAVCASGARCARFFNAIRLGNELGTFQLRELELLQDCKMHWDSTYQMISHFQLL
jgi:hypothetical protein